MRRWFGKLVDFRWKLVLFSCSRQFLCTTEFLASSWLVIAKFRFLLSHYCQTVWWISMFFTHSANRLCWLSFLLLFLATNLLKLRLTTGWGNHFGCQACKRTRMGYQCRRWVSSLFSRKRRRILCLCWHISLHLLCLCPFKYFTVLKCNSPWNT